MASQQQVSNTPASLRDSWQTPDWLYLWIEKRFNTGIDLAASHDNKKCGVYLTKDDDALRVDWYALQYHTDPMGFMFCNCPYSETGKWLEKAWIEAQKGARIVMLVPCPNGEKYFGEHVFGKASEVIFINGRVAFELPQPDGTARQQSGNTRGSCFVVFNRTYEGPTSISWINRDEVKADHENH